MAKKVIIGSDKSGFGLKEALKAHLIEVGYEVVDDGTIDPENAMMYDAVARKVAPRVSSGEFEKGILICGTGMGMSIVANKFKGVSAAVCENTFAAEKARAINDANILTLGGWISAPEVGIAIADTFLNTEFTQNLEDWRAENLKKAKVRVAELENENFK
jgi:ribose 5-phosphate isomerase B